MAIDEEMTGISIPGSGRPRKDVPPSIQYTQRLKEVPERYSIIQLGVSLFQFVNTNEWHVRNYNFFVFPNDNNNNNNTNHSSSKEVVLNPSAVAFLHSHNMSFDLWTKCGIPYCTATQARDYTDQYLKQATEQQQSNNHNHSSGRISVQDSLRRAVELRRPDDVEFFSRAMATLREWLDAGHTTTTATTNAANHTTTTSSTALYENDPDKSFVLPACNSFLRRALYENIQKEYPSLLLTKANANQIRVLRLNEAEQRQRNYDLQTRAWHDYIVNRIGMWRVIHALQLVCQGHAIDKTHPLFAKQHDHINFNKEPSFHGAMPPMVLEEHMGWKDATAASPIQIPETTTIKPSSSGRKIPLVVHNGFMDLCFLMTHFQSPTLPNTLRECKHWIHSCFPNIYDTKVMATEYITGSSSSYDRTNLGDLFHQVVVRNETLQSSIRILPPCTKAQNDEGDEEEEGEITERPPLPAAAAAESTQEHEAAYDAYMTGAIYVGLSHQIRDRHNLNMPNDNDHYHNSNEQDQARSKFGRNKLYQMSMYLLDLECKEGDPLKHIYESEQIFAVSEIDSAVTTRDIVQSLAQCIDNEGQIALYDIVWVDDTTFLVATRRRTDNANSQRMIEEIFDLHGSMIYQALCGHFGSEKVGTFENYLQQQKEKYGETEKESGDDGKGETWLDRLLRMVGLKRLRKRPNREEEPANRSNKRRRLNG